MIGIGDHPGPLELRLVVGVKQAPVLADAAFRRFPGLIEGLDDVVVDAHGIGPGHEIADDVGLLGAARHGAAAVIAAARPAELGDDHAFARIGAAEHVVGGDGSVDRLVGGNVVPVGQGVRGDEVDSGGKTNGVAPQLRPGADDFTGCDRDLRFLLDALDGLDQLVHREPAAVERLVADHDRDDIAVPAGKVDAGADLALVARLRLFSLLVGERRSVRVPGRVEPDTQRDLEAELGRNRRQGLPVGMYGRLVGTLGKLAVGRRVRADGAGIGRERAEVRAHLLDGRPSVLAART